MNNKKAYLQIISAAFLWGIVGIFTKTLASLGLASKEIVAIRFILGSAFLALWIGIRDISLFKIKLRHIPIFIAMGILGLYMFAYFYFESIDLCGMSVASVLLYTSPIYISLLSIPIFKEKFTINKLIALILTTIGTLLTSQILGTSLLISLKGIILGLLSGILYAGFCIVNKLVVGYYPPLTINLYTLIFAALASIFFFDYSLVPSLIVRLDFLATSLSLGLFSATLPYMLYTLGIRYVESSKAAIICTLEPAVAIFTGIVIFKEAITLSKVIGILLILFSVVIVNLNEIKMPHKS